MLRFFTFCSPSQRPDLGIHKVTKMIHENKLSAFIVMVQHEENI
jgi:hypothetical protein